MVEDSVPIPIIAPGGKVATDSGVDKRANLTLTVGILPRGICA